MKNSTKLLSIAALAVAAFSAFLLNVSNAQTSTAGLTRSHDPAVIFPGGTNNVSAASSNAYTGRLIEVPKADSFAVYISARPVGTNIVSLTLTLQKSLDNVSWSLHTPSTVAITGETNATSANLVSGITHVQAGAIPYWRVTHIENTETEGYATNVTVSYTFKQ